MTKRILEGIKVLDLTRFFSGPQCTLFLAGLGAEVIKVDDPWVGDPTAFSPPFAGPQGVSFEKRSPHDMGIAYLKRARSKKSATLNLKSAEGKELFMRMVKNADVVVENFSAGVADRLGVGYDVLREINPALVYCSLTGYGSTGPARNLKAYDLMVQAAVGLMSITGHPDAGPTKAGTPLSDAIAGLFAAFGIVAALNYRQRTGHGQSVDVSMADCLLSLILDEPLDCYRELGLSFQQGNRIMRFSPFNAYKSADGWVTLGTANNDDWGTLLDLMGRSDLKDDPDVMSVAWRLSNNAVVDEIVSTWTATLPTAEIEQQMRSAKIPCSPVRTIDDVLAWEQTVARNMAVSLWNPLAKAAMNVKGAAFPLRFGHADVGYDTPAPVPGAHTEEVLREMAGVDAVEFRRLREHRII
ncbi:CaiB/BaiF CoA transferase family protein [Cupriavidus sp. SS-3]|uniref:CaiB/BaiF CoA transferase family protein n=1 Tax=Cupriavidus sp. SS-3 TaxID=3109596 RepID=UPI002DBFF99F|nr:CaiB/BaiF CoA-transferase family protein [Cupriavidus sp. SS-3]MEC3764161.1 CaiB/BaiF CoA-transferase family protein [Cupriavidus sp. SS-3]